MANADQTPHVPFIVARKHLTRFSAAVSRIGPLFRPIVDKLHYEPLLLASKAKQFIDRTRENPVECNLPYSTYLSQAFPLAVLAAHGEIAPILSNYYSTLFFPHAKINGSRQVASSNLFPSCTFDTFARLGYFEAESFDLIAEDVDPTAALAFCAKSVAEGWYVSANVNEYYIKNIRWVRNRDFRHPILISGCNRTTFSFSTINYAEGVFGRIEVSAHNLAKGIVSRGTFDGKAVPNYRSTCKRLRRLRPVRGLIGILDIKLIKIQLDCYLKSTPPPNDISNPIQDIEEIGYSDGFVKNSTFGISVYSCMSDYLLFLARDFKAFDARVTRSFWEHKKILLIRLQQLETKKIVPSDISLSRRFNPVVQASQKLHFSLCDAALSRKKERNMKSCIESLSEMKSTELSVLDICLYFLEMHS